MEDFSSVQFVLLTLAGLMLCHCFRLQDGNLSESSALNQKNANNKVGGHIDINTIDLLVFKEKYWKVNVF